VNVIQPELITVTFTRNQYPGGYNITCKGYNDGSVWINTISGGNGGYTYEWSTINGTITGNNTLNRLDNITAGTYYLKITDIKGCEKTDSVIITEPNGIQLATYQLSSSADSLYNVSCNGGNNGSIKITLTGGSGSYNHSWSGPDGFTSSTKDIFNLVAGIYTDTIRDVSNASCILMPLPTFTLAEPAALNIGVAKSLSTDGSYNINCNGGTGSIDLTVTGGSVGNYQYKWTTTDGSGIIDGQADQNALTAGTYHVVVEDLNLCKDSIDITLTQPAPLSTTLIPKHITCQSPGFDNGSIDLSVSGGVGPYLFAWSNGATTEDISNLTQGYYKVTVTDLNGCQKTDSVSVDLPPPIIYTSTLSLYNSYNISCYGLSDGWIQITTTSGKAPFTYSWQYPDGLVSSLQNISGLKAGQYNLQITDSNLCTATGTFNLTEPGKLSMTITLSSSLNGGYNINCAGDSTGSINVDAVSQVGTTDYLWSDGATGKLRSDIPAGTYQLIITDQNNCHVDSTIILTEPDSIKISFDVTQAFCPDSPDGEIRLIVTGGVIGTDYSYKWSDNSTGQTISNILKGLYWVTVTDANNCSLRDSVKMEPLNETCLIIPNAISPNDDNINDVWNIGMIYLYPQIEIKIFNRWGELLWKSEKGYPRPWDGRSNGTPLPIDSYHYVIDLHNGSKPIIGNVTIVK
jgi:gliding motility-associated-like protein